MQVGDLVAARFRVESTVASGGMGTVYRAVDLRSGHLVALKSCHPSLVDVPSVGAGTAEGRAEARFALEARALSEISDAAIVGYVDQGTTDAGEPFLVMDWVEGES